jgi:hypothetical protein
VQKIVYGNRKDACDKSIRECGKENLADAKSQPQSEEQQHVQETDCTQKHASNEHLLPCQGK